MSIRVWESHGFAVIPLGPDGEPTGVSLWCATPEEADRVWNEERGAYGAYLLDHRKPGRLRTSEPC